MEIPWRSQDGFLRYQDLKRNPELVRELAEARESPELREFLLALNSPGSPFETAKCDLWSSNELNVEEEIFRASCKFGSYIDILFTDPILWKSFTHNENFVRQITSMLRASTLDPAAAEFIIRAGVRPANPESESEKCRSGFLMEEGYYATFYLYGYGTDESAARNQWAIALKFAQSAFMRF